MTVVNQAVRVAEGVFGELVILAAFCSKCQQEVQPRADGTCGWCFQSVVDEDSLSAREMLAQLRGGALPEREPLARETLPASPVEIDGVLPVAAVASESRRPSGGEPASRSESAPRKRRRKQGRPKIWTKRKIVVAMQAFADAQGRTPSTSDCDAQNVAGLPGYNAIKREFGNYSAACDAAGLPYPQRGGFRGHRASGGVRVLPTPAPPEDIAARLAALIVEAQAIQAALAAASVAA